MAAQPHPNVHSYHAPDREKLMPGRTLTLIGADGAGKSTLATRLSSTFGDRARYVYLGSNPASATHSLPTTRVWHALRSLLGRNDHRGGPPSLNGSRPPTSPARRALLHAKSLIMVALRVSEDLHRLLLAKILELRGYLVILDRHPYADYYAHRIATPRHWQRIGDRIHGFLLDRVYPRPGRVVLLDAPPEVLHARKPEGSRAAIAARRAEYRRVAETLDDVVVVDAGRPEEEVFATLLCLAASHLTRASTTRGARRGSFAG